MILAGGKGKRLRPLTNASPKSLLEVNGKPILLWQSEWLSRHGVEDIVLCAGYLREKLIEEVGTGSTYGVRVAYAVEDMPLGTGGALANAKHLLEKEDVFYVVNGDVITDLDPSPLKAKVQEGVVGAIALTPLPSPYGIIEFDASSGVIKRFKEKPSIEEYWINAGVYAFSPEIFGYLPREGDIEKTAFPALAVLGLLKAVAYQNSMWKSIDSHKDLEEAGTLLSKLYKQ
ncbi:MAG: NDP-sugar synthase [Nitrososphaeria archaeon]